MKKLLIGAVALFGVGMTWLIVDTIAAEPETVIRGIVRVYSVTHGGDGVADISLFSKEDTGTFSRLQCRVRTKDQNDIARFKPNTEWAVELRPLEIRQLERSR